MMKHRSKRELERKTEKQQKGHIKVYSKILEDLSSGIYSTPANCIKELINNSYDADATEVIIRAKPSLDIFSITDNGEGMSIEEFEDRFAIISKSYKRENSDITLNLKRPIIGKIGIGFIAVSEICDKLTIITKKRNDVGRIKAEINFKQFKNKHLKDNEEFIINSSYDLLYEEILEEEKDSYTKIILHELTKDFKDILLDKDNRVYDAQLNDILENKNYKDVIRYFRNTNVNKTLKLSEYWRFIFEIANTVPIEYLDNGPVINPQDNKILTSIKNKLRSYKFKVDFDGLELKKPILFPNEDRFNSYGEDFVVHTFDENIKIKNKKLKFKGYIYSQHGGIFPKDHSGLIIRIKNTRVGEIDSSYLNYKFVANQIYSHWNFGEIYIEEGLEDAMGINRTSFRITHPHYRALKRFIHNYLDEVVFKYCYQNFYRAKKDERKKQKTLELKHKFESFVITNYDIDKVEVIQVDEKKGEPVEIDFQNNKIILRESSRILKKYSKKEKEILQEIILNLKVALRNADLNENDQKSLLKEFYKLIFNRLMK